MAGAAGAGEGLAGAAAEGVQVGAPIVDGANLSQTGADLFGSSTPSPYYGPSSGAEAMTVGNPVTPVAPVAAPVPTVPQTDMLAGMDRVAMENPAVSGFQAQNTGSMANAQRGLSGLMDNPASRDAFMTKMGGGTGLLKTGMMAAAPALMGKESEPYKGSGPNPYEYSYDPRSGSYTRQAIGYRDAQTVTPPRMMADGGYAYSYDPYTQGFTQTGGPSAAAPDTGVMGSDNEYRYSYDPATQSYTQLSAPKARAATSYTPNYEGSAGGASGADGDGGGGGGGAGAGTGNAMAMGGLTAFAQGGRSHLGDYSDGGRMLRGPGDGVSDSIPATIGGKRPARLADGEFVVPARIVSELGNGSSEAGARKLYAMMDRVQGARKKSIGKNKVAVNSRAAKLLPA